MYERRIVDISVNGMQNIAMSKSDAIKFITKIFDGFFNNLLENTIVHDMKMLNMKPNKAMIMYDATNITSVYQA